jgi:hypothetical protein
MPNTADNPDNPKRPQRQLAFRPRAGGVEDAVLYCGVSRASIYNAGARHPGLLKKWNGRTIVDFDILDSIIDALPVGPAKPMPRLSRRGKSQNSGSPLNRSS